MDGTFFLHNTALCLLGRLNMFFDHIDLLNDQSVFLCLSLKPCRSFPCFSGHNHYKVILFHMILFFFHSLPHTTSGANDTIFINLLRPKLSCHRSEDPCPDRFVVLVYNHRRIIVKSHIGTIGPAYLFLCPDDDRFHHFAFLHFGSWGLLLSQNRQ